jgi:hypothetical protein
VIAMAGAWMLLAGLIALIRIGRAAKRRPGTGPDELQLPY